MTENQYVTLGNSYLVIAVSLGDPWDGYYSLRHQFVKFLALNVVKKEY